MDTQTSAAFSSSQKYLAFVTRWGFCLCPSPEPALCWRVHLQWLCCAGIAGNGSALVHPLTDWWEIVGFSSWMCGRYLQMELWTDIMFPVEGRCRGIDLLDCSGNVCVNQWEAADLPEARVVCLTQGFDCFAHRAFGFCFPCLVGNSKRSAVDSFWFTSHFPNLAQHRLFYYHLHHFLAEILF